jgi:predicted enzyme related to lactoylglutathione lyase
MDIGYHEWRRRDRECEAGGVHMKVGLMTVYVDDQDKALRFYTEVLGFAKN